MIKYFVLLIINIMGPCTVKIIKWLNFSVFSIDILKTMQGLEKGYFRHFHVIYYA